MVQDVLFIRSGDAFVPTEHAGSPWHPAMLHGGAPAALLAHCLEQSVSGSGLQPARLNIDLIRPVPGAPLHVDIRRIRAGRRIVLEEAQLRADDKVVAIATGLFVAPQPVDVPATAPRLPPLQPLPDQLDQISFREVLFGKSGRMLPGLHTTVALRPITQLTESGQGKAWLSLPIPVLAGEANSPFMLAALMSDFCNGVGQLNVAENVGMINSDIHLQLNRLPAGDWIGIDARALVQASGIGMISAQLHDTCGPIGQVTQTIMPMMEFGGAG